MCLAVTDRWILIIFGNTVSQKVGTWKIVRFLPRVISISALPCKIARKHGNYICSVYFRGRVMLCQQTHKTRQTYHLVRDRLYSLIHSWSNQLCAPNKTRLGTKHPAIWYAYRRCSPWLPWDRVPCQWESFSLTQKVSELYQWDIYHSICKC